MFIFNFNLNKSFFSQLIQKFFFINLVSINQNL